MQRSVGSIRVTSPGTRFVVPAAGGRHAHPLSRSHSRIRPRIPQAARAAALRDPLGAVRRAARSSSVRPGPRLATRATIHSATVRWTEPRRALRDPRSWQAPSRIA